MTKWDKMENKSSNLKFILKEIGLNLRNFAEMYHAEAIGLNEIIDSDSDKFYNNFRKELSRNNQKNIQKYFDFLFKTNEFKKSKYISNKFPFKDKIPSELMKIIKECSKQI